MPWTAAAIVGGALIGSAASNKASKGQAGAAGDANQLQWDMYNQNRADTEPWRQAGQVALNQLIGGIGGNLDSKKALDRASQENAVNFGAAEYLAANPDVAAAGVDPWTHYSRTGVNEGRAFTYSPKAQAAIDAASQPSPGGGAGGLNGEFNRNFSLADFQQDPGYAFGMQQGMRSVDNSASARGGIGGAALKAGTRYAQDYAGTKYNEAFNRWNTETTGRYNRLANIAGLGQQAVSQVGSLGANAANQMGSNMIGAGNALAANSLNQGNIYGNALSQWSAYGGRKSSQPVWGNTRGYDPYSDPNYFGGGEGE